MAVPPPPWEAAVLCVWPWLRSSAWGNLIQPFGTTWSRHRRLSFGSSLLHRIAALPMWTASILKMQWHKSTVLQVPQQLWPLCITSQRCKELPCPDFCFYRHQLQEKPGIIFQDLNSSHFGGQEFFSCFVFVLLFPELIPRDVNSSPVCPRTHAACCPRKQAQITHFYTFTAGVVQGADLLAWCNTGQSSFLHSHTARALQNHALGTGK